MNTARRASVLLISAIVAAGATAQSYVCPAKGQSPDQQKKDESECYTWAVGSGRPIARSPTAAVETLLKENL